MEKGDETLAYPAAAAGGQKTAPIGCFAGDDVAATTDRHPTKSYAAVAAEKTLPNGSVEEDEVTVTAAENPAKSYAAVVAEKTSPNGSVAEDEVTVTAAENRAKSYADVAAEKTYPNGNVEEDEVSVTAAVNPAKSYATVAAEKTVPDGSVAEDEVTVTAVNPAKSYAAVAANAEIEDLRTTNHDLEEKLAAADREKKGRATEIDGLKDTSDKAKQNSVVFQYIASSSDAKVLALREELEDLQKLLQAEKDEFKADKRDSNQLAGKVGSERAVKMRLEEEVIAMKERARARAAAAAAAAEDERVAAPTPGTLQGARVAWPVMAGAAAVGAAAATVAVVIFLRLKR
uniref:Uncharacterized protein n=1 Tax=Oryza barthii TaxID=65489 RepID=A0A0D3ESW6_9ORYZ